MKKLLLLTIFALAFISSKAQTGISAAGTAPDASAMLDVIATDKGMLIPRVALTSTGVAAPVAAPATSLMVYNTATAGDVTPGFYYWNGSAWSRLLNGSTNLSGAGTTNYLARWTPNGSTLGIGTSYDNGINLGIGTTNPLGKLHVSTAVPTGLGALPANSVGIIENGAANNYIIFRNTVDNGTYSGLQFQDNNVGGYIAFRNYVGSGANDGTNGDYMVYGTYTDHIFQTGASEAVNGKTEVVRMKQDGKVGIGTPSPSYKLVVQKTSPGIALMVGGSGGGPRIQTYGLDADGNAWMGLGTDMGGNPYEHSIYFSKGTSNNGRLTIGDYDGTTYNTRVTVLQNGNVGIAATAPGAKFQINPNFTNLGGRLLTSNQGGWQADGVTPEMVISTNSASTNRAALIGLNLHNDNTTNNVYAPFITFSRRSNSTSYNSAFAAIGAQATGQGSDANWVAGDLIFSTENGTMNGLGERMRLDRSGRLYLLQNQGGDPNFTGLEDPTSAAGRAQLVLSSSYSDLVIASSEGNDNHGSTLTFATYNPGNTADYRKFVINQGNWGARRGFLDFGFADAGGRSNPHSNINGTDNVISLDGYNKRLGVGTMAPNGKLDVMMGNSDGIVMYQPTDDNMAIQGYLNGQWSNRTTYAGGCCNKLLLQPDIGEVGIRTTNPTAVLDVNGSMRIRSLGAGMVRSDGSGNLSIAGGGDVPAGSNNYIQNQYAGAQTAEFWITGRAQIQGTTRHRGDMELDGGSTFYFGREESFGGGDIGGSDYGFIRWDNDNNSYNRWGDSGENGALIIGSQNDGANTVSDVVVLQGVAANIFDAGSGINFFTGNIGVNTPNPTRRLDVVGRQLVREGTFPNGWDVTDWGALVSLRRPGAANMAGAHHGNSQLALENDGPTTAHISFHRPGLFGANFGLDTDNWFSTQGWSGGTAGFTNFRTGTLDLRGAITSINGFFPPNNAIRLTPNMHVNTPPGNALIVNWDNGAVGGGTWQFRVGNGTGTDQFYVRADGQFYGRYFGDHDNGAFFVDPTGQSLVNKFRADGNGSTGGHWGHDPYGQGWGSPHGSFRSLEVSTSGNYSNEPAMFRIHQWGSGAAEFWKPQGRVLYLRETPGATNSWFNRFDVQTYREGTDWSSSQITAEICCGSPYLPAISFHWPGYYAPMVGMLNNGGIVAMNTAGNNGAPMYAQGYNGWSDINVKKDITDLGNNDYFASLDNIMNIRSIKYRFNTESDVAGMNDGTSYREYLHIGFEAQSLPKEVYSELLNANVAQPGVKGMDFKGYGLTDMDGLLVAGVKALNIKLEEQNKIIEELKKEIELMKAGKK